MKTASDFHVRRAVWSDDRERLSTIRTQVFILEQRVPTGLEWDGLDDSAIHLIAEDHKGLPLGCARLLPNGQIGRMAVLRPWRGKGIGRALLRLALDIARAEGYDRVFLNAQVSVRDFYARQGFSAVGDIFTEADIAHIRMESDLQPATS